MSKRVHFSKQPLRTGGNLAIIKGSKKTKKKAETRTAKKPEWNVRLVGGGCDWQWQWYEGVTLVFL